MNVRPCLKRRVLPFVLVGILISGAAGADFIGVARTDLLDRAPYVRMYAKARPAGAVSVLPVTLDPVSTEEPGDASRRQALQVLAEELDRYARSADWMNALDTPVPRHGAPWVYAGVSDGDYAPSGVTMETDDVDGPQMILYTQKPSKAWRRGLSALLVEHDLAGAVVVSIGLSEFPKSYRGVFKKRVVLGTGHDTEIRFLSAELEPVHVLYVTGVLVDREGAVLGAGAEGVLAEDTPFWAQSFDVKKELDPESILQAIEGERRADLPDNPLALHVAFHNLVAQLLGEPSRIISQ